MTKIVLTKIVLRLYQDCIKIVLTKIVLRLYQDCINQDCINYNQILFSISKIRHAKLYDIGAYV
jgi:hypothetical protein